MSVGGNCSFERRREIIGRRWRDIVADCETVIRSVDHPDLTEPSKFVVDILAALRDGHSTAAQALWANLLDTVLKCHIRPKDRSI
ncbi:hypothetical protein HUT13_02010 [Streptomyces harbinensis]|uniref:hypothetical protein n=1 Tax=Streptomyces harbinensis TaxID=1176198 RepID=UPI001592A0FA|nr:hypothetical protein [Streptomyces harbinensis]QKV67682.1 hypothetical protein HUT13_02010 [Streptomyces harbinensis]